MNLTMFGLKPISNKSSYFTMLDDVKQARKHYRENPIQDFRIFDKMTFINNMSCLEALKLLNSTFSLNNIAYKKLLRNHYIYFDGILVQLSKMPFDVIIYIYNHIFWEQEGNLNELKVGDIDMFRFEGI